jgi:spore coat polysaccharide biosynthesis protein SpsF (cytidylyltransferase family)
MLKKKDKIGILLAARSGSKRLPNKHFLKFCSNLSVIDICILRLKKTKMVNKIFLCTTKNKIDNKFIKVCKNHNIKLYRGSTNNVSKRLIDCARENLIETIVRITADCPIIDPIVIDKCIKLHFLKKCDYTSNVLDLSFPDGLDVEVFNLKSLISSQKLSKTKHNKEHVTPFLRRSKRFKKYSFKNSKNYSNRRWTLDYFRDYIFLKRVIKYFSNNIFFSWKELINAEKANKDLINIKNR